MICLDWEADGGVPPPPANSLLLLPFLLLSRPRLMVLLSVPIREVLNGNELDRGEKGSNVLELMTNMDKVIILTKHNSDMIGPGNKREGCCSRINRKQEMA